MRDERRYVTDDTELRVETTPEGESRIVGYAAVFGKRSVDLGGFTEEIAPGAFSRSLKDDDVAALVDHDPSRIIGRKSSGTLRLAEDRVGLRMEVDIPDTTVGRDILESIRRGDVRGQSFGFRTVSDDWRMEDGLAHRTLIEARLRDVGPVTFPAYPDTTVAVRSLEMFRNAGGTRQLTFYRSKQRQSEAEGK